MVKEQFVIVETMALCDGCGRLDTSWRCTDCRIPICRMCQFKHIKSQHPEGANF